MTTEPDRAPIRLFTETTWGRAAVAVAVGALGLWLAWVVLDLPPDGQGLTRVILERLDEAGPESTLTATLLNFRVYDTFLEVGVVLLAAVAALALRGRADVAAEGAVPTGSPVVRRYAHRIAPVMLLLGIYLVSRGTWAPGGALEAGALVATAAMVLRLAGDTPLSELPGVPLRAGVVVAALAFVTLGAVTQATEGAPFELPAAWAYRAIVALEITIVASVGASLAVLFVTASPPSGAGERERIEGGRR